MQTIFKENKYHQPQQNSEVNILNYKFTKKFCNLDKITETQGLPISVGVYIQTIKW